MELAEESEHQRMGIFPSKAKVTTQGPWQTMEVFIRSSAPSLLNVCENVEKQSWSWYQQANSVSKKNYSPESVTVATVHFKFQPSFTKSGRSCFLNNSEWAHRLPRQLLQKAVPEGFTYIHIYTDIPNADFQGFQETCTHAKCCQRETKPKNPSSRKEYTLQPCATAGAVDSSLSQLPWGSTGPWSLLRGSLSCCCLCNNKGWFGFQWKRIPLSGRCPCLKQNLSQL